MDKKTTITKTISIIIPALNESDGIAKTIAAIPTAELAAMGYTTRVLVVDNGSADGTGEKARKAGAEVVHEPKRGYGYAYKAGFGHASSDIIATTDADMTYPVGDIPALVRLLEDEDLDFITTNRRAYLQPGAMSRLHRLGNAVLNLTTRLLFRLNLKDSQSGMWVLRRDVLDRLVLRANSMALSEELKVEACYFARCRWKEVPIHYGARMGKTKLKSWRDGFRNLFHLIRKRLWR